MTKYSYAETVKVLPLLASVDIAAAASNAAWIDLNNAAGLVEIEINFGLITSTDTTAGALVTIEASTAGSSSDTTTAVPFSYRLSEAVGTDSLGAITATASTDGVTLNSSTDDGKLLLCYVDPSVVAETGTDLRYIRPLIDAAAAVSATLVGAVARYTPRYAGNSMPSST